MAYKKGFKPTDFTTKDTLRKVKLQWGKMSPKQKRNLSLEELAYVREMALTDTKSTDLTKETTRLINRKQGFTGAELRKENKSFLDKVLPQQNKAIKEQKELGKVMRRWRKIERELGLTPTNTPFKYDGIPSSKMLGLGKDKFTEVFLKLSKGEKISTKEFEKILSNDSRGLSILKKLYAINFKNLQGAEGELSMANFKKNLKLLESNKEYREAFIKGLVKGVTKVDMGILDSKEIRKAQLEATYEDMFKIANKETAKGIKAKAIKTANDTLDNYFDSLEDVVMLNKIKQLMQQLDVRRIYETIEAITSYEFMKLYGSNQDYEGNGDYNYVESDSERARQRAEQLIDMLQNELGYMGKFDAEGNLVGEGKIKNKTSNVISFYK